MLFQPKTEGAGRFHMLICFGLNSYLYSDYVRKIITLVLCTKLYMTYFYPLKCTLIQILSMPLLQTTICYYDRTLVFRCTPCAINSLHDTCKCMTTKCICHVTRKYVSLQYSFNCLRFPSYTIDS